MFMNLKRIASLLSITLVLTVFVSTTERLYSQCSLACNGNTQISLDVNCEAEITADMILNDQATSCMGGSFQVFVEDEYGVIATSPTVTGIYCDKSLKARVVDTNTGNACWGNIHIEDKLGPIATCPDPNIVDMDCADMRLYDGPEFIDNCSGTITPILLSEQIETLCDPNFIKQITRSYTAVDSKGNEAPNVCTVTLRLRRINWDQVLYPDSYEIVNNTFLDCGGDDWDTNNNGYPDPEEVGVPMYETSFMGQLDTIDLYPFPDVYCNTVVTFEDTVLPKIGCTQKIMRRWTVREWHCNGEVTANNVQVIEITDQTGPEIVCGENITVTTNTLLGGGHSSVYGNVSCGSTVSLPVPQTTDNCSSNITIDVLYDGGLTQDYDGSQAITVPMGLSLVQYTAYDECYNSSSCIIHVNVVDNTPPVAVCDQNTVVSLTTGGEAVVPATSFDDGSYDDCKTHCMLVRRMDTGSCDCHQPEFCDLDYVGEFNGSHYYLSNYNITADIAKARAAAYGGGLVVFNTEEEEEYVIDAVRARYQDRFWIGAKRFGSGFTWDDHTAIVDPNWAMGQPSNDPGEDCVMITPSNEWNDASCFGEWRYVLEINDPCGFSRGAKFCCADTGVDQMVVFRIVDIFGNFNECMVNVDVQDKVAPQVVCPPDMTADCDATVDASNLDALFGTASVLDDCGAEIISNPDDQVNQCNVGELTRIFTATDSGGRSSTCKQVITFENDDPFDGTLIRCPSDTTIVGCSAPSDLGPDVLGSPYFPSDPCDLIGVDFDDEVFTFNNQNTDACLKILRTWQIVDWCQQDPYNGLYPTWGCQQVIKISNGVKPVISGCKPEMICTYDSDCEDGFIELIVTATDDCTEESNLSWRYEVFAGQLGLGPDPSLNNPIIVESGEGGMADASGKYPIGTHLIRWTFFDRCGNATTCNQPFTIQNCKAPTAYCINGLAVDLMPVDSDFDGNVDFGMVELWASDFDAGSHHPCGYEVFLSFSADTADKNILFDCTNLGANDVDLWVSVVGHDGILNQSFCTSFIDVQDNTGACQGLRESVSVDGSVFTENFESMEDIEVILDGSPLTTMTDNEGEYAFPNMPTGGEYVINPYSNSLPLNGVSTFDLIKIQQHITGSEALSSPYKIIAADINNDKNVTALDLIELRKLILGVYDEFPNNDSWRFVDRDYSFVDVNNPFNESFTEDYEIPSLDADMTIDFIAIKVGDVNNTVTVEAKSNELDKRSNNSIALLSKVIDYRENQKIEIPFVFDAKDIRGYQLSMTYDTEKLNVTGLKNNDGTMSNANYVINSNEILISWNTLIPSEAQFVIEAETKVQGNTSNVFTVTNTLSNEVYNSNGIKGFSELKIGNEIQRSEFTLFQNQPNPFTNDTNVKFYLPESDNIQLSVTDLQGRVIHAHTGNYASGMNSLTINKEHIGQAGIYHLTITTSTNKESIKMILIK